MKRIPFPRSLGILTQFSDITAAGIRTNFDGVSDVLGDDLTEKRKFRDKWGSDSAPLRVLIWKL